MCVCLYTHTYTTTHTCEDLRFVMYVTSNKVLRCENHFSFMLRIFLAFISKNQGPTSPTLINGTSIKLQI